MNKLRFSQKLFFGSVLIVLALGFSLSLIYKKMYIPKDNNLLVGLKAEKNSSNLDVYLFGEIPKFNPISPDGLYVWWLQSLVWDKLILVDKDFVWHKNLVKSWVFNKNRTELILKFDSDIFWSNGRKVNEDDFKFSFHFYKDESLKAAIYKPIFERIGSVTYKDRTLNLKLNPDLKSDPFYATQTYWSHVLSAAHLYPVDLATNPFLGTGPYRVDSFSNQGKIKFSLNDNSWFLKTYKGIQLPKTISVKSLISESVLKKIVEKQEGLIVGKDISSLKSPNWHPVESKQELVSVVFNLKEVLIHERHYFYQKISEANDLEKLDLKLRGRNIYGSTNPVVKAQLKNKLSQKDVFLKTNGLNEKNKEVKKESKNMFLKLKVMYAETQDEVWLTYLAEKLKNTGVELVLTKTSSSVLYETVYGRKFISFVDRNPIVDFYPHYLSFHSKGSYNFNGWDSKNIDHDLEDMVNMDNSDQIKMKIQKIRNEMNQEFFEVPIFSYESAVLWTRNPCKPIQTQFQGLGLIYKAIICADNL